MREKHVHLQVLFSQLQPELLRRQLLQASSLKRVPPKDYVSSQGISEEMYLHLAHSVEMLAGKTQDELKAEFHSLKEFLDERPAGGVLSLLEKYAADVLCFWQGEPVCRQQSIFSWRNQALQLGQDIFTCADLAALDLKEHCVTRSFLWAPVIRTDRVDLQSILERGLAENHYHMNGSTQIFPISWAYLMNHPESIRAYYKAAVFREDMDGTYSFGVQDNRISWVERMQEAAWIRQRLFECICGRKDEQEIVRRYADLVYAGDVFRDLIIPVRSSRVPLFQQEKPDEAWRMLDYALLPAERDDHELPESSRRLLAGERYLLYHCFRRCYDGTFPPKLCDLFYLYLLYRIRFRKELVQTNGRAGFRNFAEYQDRKATIWGNENLYGAESCRLSAANTLFRPSQTAERTEKRLPVRTRPRFEEKERCVTSLEMRVMPKTTAAELERSIYITDWNILHGMNMHFSRKTAGGVDRQTWERQMLYYLEEDAPFFYVLHFAKLPQEYISQKRSEKKLPYLRNGKLHKLIRQQALATADALNQSSYLCSRIRGIDACNHEIGCRPEVFATEFRYLRTLPFGNSNERRKRRHFPLLAATYHVGEDFLDLTDGLRAIDEAVCFLNLRSGERLGHALALGTLPKTYYESKAYAVTLPAQDLMDNLIWLLFRTLEWDVPMPSSLRKKLEQQATALLQLLYGTFQRPGSRATETYSLEEAYEAWKLRGDHPELYRLERRDPEAFRKNLLHTIRNDDGLQTPYRKAMLNQMNWRKDSRFEQVVTEEEYLRTRLNDKIVRLTYLYFYDPKVRWNGQRMREFQITTEYAEVIHTLQNRMMEKIGQRGIAIECNPSSNQLIGAFGAYRDHPVFRFNHTMLPLEQYSDQPGQLRVSINTDDLGVFDTSIENEFALIYSALQQDTDEDGRQKIGDQQICAYLEQLREMGHEMTFPKAELTSRKRENLRR